MSLMQKVFIGAAGVAVVCFGYLFVTTTTTSNVVAGLDERTKATKEDVGEIKDDIRAMRATLGDIKAGVAANASGIEKLLSKISANPEKASGFTPLLVGKWKGFYIDDLENFIKDLPAVERLDDVEVRDLDVQHTHVMSRVEHLAHLRGQCGYGKEVRGAIVKGASQLEELGTVVLELGVAVVGRHGITSWRRPPSKVSSTRRTPVRRPSISKGLVM